MSEDLGAVAVTAGVNALAGLISRVPWSEIGGRVVGVLTRRGRAVDPRLARALDGEPDAEPGGEPGEPDGEPGGEPGESTRSLRLAAALTQVLPPEDLAVVTRELEALGHRTEITLNGGKNAVHTGSGDQNVTFN
ncbi:MULTISPECIES: hypothetical protein [unclassified Streptomyces]|uniref:hypothetical protein n=1 Tax=unclassified Streptomyces TaxID=2593676 RepID=UPI002DDC831B|nr:hypothetical protein [Streptomyces sp. NBC_01766]WSC21422.1 hypothetical protein OIE60_17990 [Streptomyces sp. NBC_01766]WSV55352.1 hypothetical protein OG282_17520 [Streptomyces sp. NBC_01014]